MSDRDNGGLAFPGTFGPPSEYNYGMTLRDWFAGQCIRVTMDMNEYNINEYQAAGCARFAYMVADAMLKERAK